MTLVAVSVVLFLLTPRAPEVVSVAGWSDLAARTVAGAYHVHTIRSDGHGDKAAVAAAAARAGLKFVILTDHGDATRPPDPPEYINGVLMLDAVEISTDDGHYVALDMPRAPYPLGGAGAAVVEDVHRLGGFGIAAHPDSPKPALRWTDRTAPIDGIEWLNADSEWRDESRAHLVRAGFGYLFRPGGALATLLDRPGTLDRWDGLSRTRRVIGIAGVDAHGGPGQRLEDQSRTLPAFAGIPSYEASFRELSVRVILRQGLSGVAADDGHAVYEAIRRGSLFTAIDAIAGPALLDFHAVPAGPTVSLIAGATLPRGAEVVLLGPGGEVARSRGELRHEVSAGTFGAYRVEVRVPRAPGNPPVPWLVSNPVFVGQPPSAARPATSGEQFPASDSAIPVASWRIEKDQSSSAILRTSARGAELDYQLAAGARHDQFVALATDLHKQEFGGVDLDLTSDQPARVSVQIRTADGRRWGSSIYVDSAGTRVGLELVGFRPIGSEAPVPEPVIVTSILLVVDLTNALPGRRGNLVIRAASLSR